MFFLDSQFPSPSAKYYAFGTWLTTIVRLKVIASISFIFIREMVIWTTKQYLNDPNAKLLPNLPNVIRVRKIEKLIKPISFTIKTLATPLLVIYKRAKININTPPRSTASPSNKQMTPRLGLNIHISTHSISSFHKRGGGTGP